MAAQRKSGTRGLTTYPRPSVAVDIAVLTLPRPGTPDVPAAPHVLLIRRETGFAHGEWSLPGAFLGERETLAAAVDRCLRDKAGVRGLAPRQLHVFDNPHRDDRGWVLSVGHVVVLPYDDCDPLTLDADRARLVPVENGRVRPPGRRRTLPFDHDRIVALAIEDLRSRYASHPDPDGLLPRPVTVRELRQVHEAIAGQPLLKDTFRRTVLGQLTATGRFSEGARGKPAELFDVLTD